MDSDELEDDLRQARALYEEEAARAPVPRDPVQPLGGYRGAGLADEDILVLRRKHPFLAEFSDQFIRSTPIGDLMKIQSTALKAGELEKAKDVEERLAYNKSALASTIITVSDSLK
jgi:hypothetical protein